MKKIINIANAITVLEQSLQEKQEEIVREILKLLRKKFKANFQVTVITRNNEFLIGVPEYIWKKKKRQSVTRQILDQLPDEMDTHVDFIRLETLSTGGGYTILAKKF